MWLGTRLGVKFKILRQKTGQVFRLIVKPLPCFLFGGSTYSTRIKVRNEEET